MAYPFWFNLYFPSLPFDAFCEYVVVVIMAAKEWIIMQRSQTRGSREGPMRPTNIKN